MSNENKDILADVLNEMLKTTKKQVYAVHFKLKGGTHLEAISMGSPDLMEYAVKLVKPSGQLLFVPYLNIEFIDVSIHGSEDESEDD